MIVIDGEQFKIDVLSVKRSADFLDKYAERLGLPVPAEMTGKSIIVE